MEVVSSCFRVSFLREQVLQLLGELEAEIIKDGEETQKLYEEFTDYCKGSAKDTQFAIKTGKSAAKSISRRKAL